MWIIWSCQRIFSAAEVTQVLYGVMVLKPIFGRSVSVDSVRCELG